MRVLVLTNSAMGLYKFRRELIEELAGRGCEICVSLPADEFVPKLVGLGCRPLITGIDRRGVNPLADLNLLFTYRRQIRALKPDVVLTYTIKPNVYGGLACRLAHTPYLANITGLGTSINSSGLMKGFVLGLYRAGLKKAACVFFQNAPNRRLFVEKGIARGRTNLIPGSGVNLEQYCPAPYPERDEPVNFLYIGRMMKEKGLDELLSAARVISKAYAGVRFSLVGPCEEDYAVRFVDLEREGIIRYYGLLEDVRPQIAAAHATVLPSYHEGTSNVLLESASMGRPVLASRVTGCVETFDEGSSGIGFEAGNAASLAAALARFIALPYEKKRAMGEAGRAKMEREYDRRKVVAAYAQEIYSLGGHV